MLKYGENRKIYAFSGVCPFLVIIKLFLAVQNKIDSSKQYKVHGTEVYQCDGESETVGLWVFYVLRKKWNIMECITYRIDN